MGEPQSIFVKWVFPSILLAFALAMLLAISLLLAREMIQTEEAWREWQWRDRAAITP